MIIPWTGYAAAASAMASLLAVGDWRLRRRRARRSRRAAHATGADALNAPQADVAAAAQLALDRLAALIIRGFMRVDVAIPAGMQVRLRGALLADLLQEVLTAAIHGAPASRLLLAGLAHGDHVEITVADDMPNADQAYRLAQVRGLVERVALLGGTLRVTAHATEGTTIALRLPGAPGPSRPRGDLGPPCRSEPEPDTRRPAEAYQLR